MQSGNQFIDQAVKQLTSFILLIYSWHFNISLVGQKKILAFYRIQSFITAFFPTQKILAHTFQSLFFKINFNPLKT